MLLLKLADIPDDIAESFYRGQTWVGVKDAIFQPSTPMRHAAELVKILELEGLKEQTDVLLLYTDGGACAGRQ